MSTRRRAAGAAKRIAVETLGWVLVVAGIAALVLPGPGMLMLFSGLAILAQSYPWARRLLTPVKIKALLGAAEGVETIPRIILSTLGALWVGAFGVLWLWQPPAPSWWPLRADWWLIGGRTVGVTLVVSCFIAIGLLVYSIRRFHGRPEEVEDVRAMQRAHLRAMQHWREQRRGPEEPIRDPRE